MKIKYTCSSGLSDKYDCDFNEATPVDLERGASVKTLIEASGISEHEVKVAFVNGKSSGPGKTLNDGDWVVLVPTTGEAQD